VVTPSCRIVLQTEKGRRAMADPFPHWLSAKDAEEHWPRSRLQSADGSMGSGWLRGQANHGWSGDNRPEADRSANGGCARLVV
jgi:hypothetical protein